MEGLYTIDVETIGGERTNLNQYRGKVLIIVNVASKCGFTSQYDGLEELYKKYFQKGLVILGFPCNQFGQQEPGSEQEIMDFCRLNYGVTFPMFAKIELNGDNVHPLFEYLKRERPGLLGSRRIKWNFTKFLVSKEGKIVSRYASAVKPEKIDEDVKKLL